MASCPNHAAIMNKLLLIIPLCFLTANAKNEELDGRALYQVNVQTLDQVRVLSEIAEQYLLDIWTYAVPGRDGQVLVPRDLRQIFQKELEASGLTYKVQVENIKQVVDLEDKLLTAAASTADNRAHPGLPFDRVHRYEVVDRYLVDLARLYPNVVRVVSGGRSVEGRDIKYLRISTTNFQDRSKPIVLVMSLLHAREWVTLPATLYAIHKLVIDVTEEDLLRDIDWIILPIANPDGYEFTHTTNRFWRKNRSHSFLHNNITGICVGVDLNRNFDVFFGGIGTSVNLCSEIFRGRGPFSEPETLVIRDIVREHRNRLEMFLDIHSFGSMILYGFGTGRLPDNAVTINQVAGKMAQRIDAVKWPQNDNYIFGNVVKILYPVSGCSTDYAQSQNISLSYTYELPAYANNVGINGFLLDPDFIEQAGFETWEGIKEGARWVVENTRRKQLKGMN